MPKILKKIIQKSIGTIGYEIKKMSPDPVVDKDKNFIKIYNKCKAYTMTSKERMYALYKSVEYIIRSKTPGGFVECGVWKGGNAMLIAYALLELNEIDRKIYLYDTFEGMSLPTKKDYRLSGKNIKALEKHKKKQKQEHNEWCYASLAEVENNMISTKYPKIILFLLREKLKKLFQRMCRQKLPS